MPRADSLVLATGVRFKRCVLAPLESSMSCILGMICVACMLCVEITLVRPFTDVRVRSVRTIKATQDRCALWAWYNDKLNGRVRVRQRGGMLQQKVACTFACDAFFTVFHDNLATRHDEDAAWPPKSGLRRESAAHDTRSTLPNGRGEHAG